MYEVERLLELKNEILTFKKSIKSNEDSWCGEEICNLLEDINRELEIHE